MSHNLPQLDRSEAARQGQEAVEIIRNGHYTTADGCLVDISRPLEQAVQGTQAYPPDIPFPRQKTGPFQTQIEVRNETTLAAARRLIEQDCRPAALNFASATHPGGGFLSGARAQEEYLARSSGLYACLKDQPMYEHHRQRPDPLYTSYLLYSPGVPVFRDDQGQLLPGPFLVGIITAAAPNAYAMGPGREAEIEAAFRERIARVLWTGLLHRRDSLVLGAWGCGAFGNDPRRVSRLFYQALTEDFAGAYRQVTFAILDSSPDQRFIGPFEASFEG